MAAAKNLVDIQTGYVVPTGDLERALIAIRNVYSSNKFVTNLSCRERVVKLYDMVDRYNEYINLYKTKIN
jgi:hypothetical protein